MSYQALARKWRPKNFDEVVGQNHVVQTLANALDQERIHHAYLFTGTRGVGKTTIARIFAKCLNCERGVSSAPCGKCTACQEIDQGRFLDLIEVDAASRTKVEDTRELLDNVQYSPARGNFKVYLIDEVHMLSAHSFNALLKTLEEPPPHVKFLLATTDSQKLPITVLSRCLQFNLKRLPNDAIAKQLESLMQEEAIDFDKSALRSLAHAADGSMRDALSLLDQAIAYSDGNVTESAITEMLGTVPREFLQNLMHAIANNDASMIMQCTYELSQLSADFASLFEDIIHVLHQAALLQAVPGIADTLEYDRTIIENLSKLLLPEDVQLFYQIALLGKRDMYLSPSPQGALEMTLLRMLTFKPAGKGKLKNDVFLSNSNASINETSVSKEKNITPKFEGILNLKDNKENWSKLITNLNLQGVTDSLASNCSINTVSDSTIILTLEKQHEGIATKSSKLKLENALQDYFGKDLRLKIEISSHERETPAMEKDRENSNSQSRAEKKAQEDEVVKAFKSKFGAEIVEGSVKPIGEPVEEK